MISKNCRYSYYDIPMPYGNTSTPSLEVVKILNTKRIRSITGYRDGLVIVYSTSIVIMSPSNMPTICRYEPDIIKLFGTNPGITDIINSYLDKKCESVEQAMTCFMAKILGSHE